MLKKRNWKKVGSPLEALGIDNENSYVLVGLGDLHRETGKYHKAIGFYEKTLEIDTLNMFALRGWEMPIGDSARQARPFPSGSVICNRIMMISMC